MDILCDINTECKQHVGNNTKRKKLYIRILEAIYGMIESALLWYNL